MNRGMLSTHLLPATEEDCPGLPGAGVVLDLGPGPRPQLGPVRGLLQAEGHGGWGGAARGLAAHNDREAPNSLQGGGGGAGGGQGEEGGGRLGHRHREPSLVPGGQVGMQGGGRVCDTPTAAA